MVSTPSLIARSIKSSMMTVRITTDQAPTKLLGTVARSSSVLAGELGGQGIAEQRLLALGLGGAEAGRHEGGVRDVLDDLGHGS